MSGSSGAQRVRAGTREKRSLWLSLAVLVGLATAVRLVGWDAAHAPDGWHLVDPDSQYHVYRIEHVRDHFPALPPAYEPLVGERGNYPLIWPPGLAVMGGGLSWLLGISADAAGSWLMVLFGALLVVPVTLTARLLGRRSRRAAMVPAGLVAALHPAFVEYGRIGRVDHHVLEPLVLAAAGYFILRATGKGAPDKRATGESAGRPVDAWLGGALLGVGFWLWPTALYVAVIVLGGLMLVGYLRRDASAARTGVHASLTAALVLAPLLLLMPVELRWALQGPSLVHLMVLVALSAGFLILGALLRASHDDPRRRRHYLVGVPASWVVLGLGVVLLLDDTARALALEFGGRRGLWSMLLEQRPLFGLPFDHARVLGTYLVLAFPVTGALAACALRQSAALERSESLSLLSPGAERAGVRGSGPRTAPAKRVRSTRRRRATRWWLMASWLVLALPIGLLQLRFLPLLVVCATPFAALGTTMGARLLLRRRPALAALSAVLLMAIQLSPVVEYLGLMERPGGKLRAREALGRLLSRAPLPEGEGVVLGPVGVGHHVVRFGRRPVVGTPFIEPRTEATNRAVLAFAVTDDWNEALRIVHERRVRWVVVEPLPPHRYERFCRHLGQSPNAYEQSVAFQLANGRAPPWLRPIWASNVVDGWGRVLLYEVVPR